VLRAFAIIYLVMAGIALLAGLVAAGWALVAAPWNVGNRIVLALLALAGTFFLVVGSLAIAEIIKLFMDIEHNTRLSAMRRPETPVSSEPATETAMRSNRLRELDEETAESALVRGR
jgi:hypothetical protein